MSPARKKPSGPMPVESTRHADRRVNIPTGELADFVADAERQPGTALYPRDPSLDPQLVWKGKDAQDLAEYLGVSTVPVYIQEKVDPRALVENLRQTAVGGADEPESTTSTTSTASSSISSSTSTPTRGTGRTASSSATRCS